ncbi:unnamed protein product [Sphenostylis stenocarpa]|uniref:Uncharacterized protein n=1 Tax=Sphenostylis stenocarpa TaxID=92480 RepID=A0AA86TQW8_9FABA|nr:unnamed protein product [Sphenostylis stenocarpa]
MCSPICPSARPQTIPSSSLSLKRTIFFTGLCGLVFGVSLSWSEYHRENRKARRTFLPPFYLSFPLSFISFLLVLSCWVLLSLSAFSFILFHNLTEHPPCR